MAHTRHHVFATQSGRQLFGEELQANYLSANTVQSYHCSHTDKMYRHLEKNHLMPAEQKGCRKGSYGCKEILLLNKVILNDVKKRKRNLSMAWIDYQKAFDSVPHDWI